MPSASVALSILMLGRVRRAKIRARLGWVPASGDLERIVYSAFPSFLVIAVTIKLDSPGPIFFRQERVGKDGRIG